MIHEESNDMKHWTPCRIDEYGEPVIEKRYSRVRGIEEFVPFSTRRAIQRSPYADARTPPANRNDVTGESRRIASALEVARRFGGIDDARHKAWVIDQMVRALTGERYSEFVAEAKTGEDGPNVREWDEGVAP